MIPLGEPVLPGLPLLFLACSRATRLFFANWFGFGGSGFKLEGL